MTEAKTEPTPPGEPRPGSPEILDLTNYGGLYGRLLVATQFPPKAQESILNPETPVDINLIPIITPSEGRDYSPITWNLSATERINAWGRKPLRGKDFDDAYKEWRRKFTNAINADQKRKEAFAVIYGREADQFSEDDTDVLYGRLCSGKSDTTQFSRTSADNLHLRGVDGKIDPEKLQKLQELKDEIEKIASWLFGKQTAPLVTRMVEIEASITSEGQAAIDAIISNPERLNKLTENEIKILAPVHEWIVKGPPPGLEVVPVAPLATLEEEDEGEHGGAAAQPATPTPPPVTPLAGGAAAPAPGPEPEPQPEPEPTENVEALTAKTADELKRQLIYGIGQNQTAQHVTFEMTVDNITTLMSSIAGDQLINPGTVQIGTDNKIQIKRMEIDTQIPLIGTVNVDITLFNNPHQKGEIDVKVDRGPRVGKGKIEEKLKEKLGGAKKMLTGLVKDDYPKWTAGDIAIDSEKKRVTIGFYPKTPLGIPPSEGPAQPAAAFEAPETPPQGPQPDEPSI